MKHKILVVEDDPKTHQLYQEELGGVAEIIIAISVPEAMEKFDVHYPGISIIVMDGQLPEDTRHLVKRIRAKFNGPMIAASDNVLLRMVLSAAGCNHVCAKHRVPQKVCEILNLKVML